MSVKESVSQSIFCVFFMIYYDGHETDDDDTTSYLPVIIHGPSFLASLKVIDTDTDVSIWVK